MRAYDERAAVPAERRAARRAPVPVVSRVSDPAQVLHLQRTAGNGAVAQLMESPVLDVVGKGGGQPLDTDVKNDMEQRIGADLSGVRVHTDGKAASSAASVQARAYTVGDEIVFNQGEYSPKSSDGKKTLAHELTHVVQQRQGPVEGTDTGGGIAVSDPSDRFEQAAEANAEAVTAQTLPDGAAVDGTP